MRQFGCFFMYRLVVFDLDGTVLDTLRDLHDSMNAALAAFDFPPRSMEEIRQFVGNGIRKLVERSVPPQTPAETVNAVFSRFNEHYAVHCADHTKPYDGILSLLRRLRDAGTVCAVVSNKADYAVSELCRRYFGDLIALAVGARDGVQKKPSPDSTNEVIRRLGIPKTDAVYVGDSEVDVLTAKNAGLPCVSVDWGFRDPDVLCRSGATCIVSTVEALGHALGL